MNTVLWIVQGLLAAMFLMAGMMKLMQPKEKMAEKMGWVEDFDAAVIKRIGMVEALGAAGLILPRLTGILPFLTPLAALGLAATMVGAARTHMRRNEPGMLALNAMLFLLAAFAAYGRFVLAP